MGPRGCHAPHIFLSLPFSTHWCFVSPMSLDGRRLGSYIVSATQHSHPTPQCVAADVLCLSPWVFVQWLVEGTFIHAAGWQNVCILSLTRPGRAASFPGQRLQFPSHQQVRFPGPTVALVGLTHASRLCEQHRCPRLRLFSLPCPWGARVNLHSSCHSRSGLMLCEL